MRWSQLKKLITGLFEPDLDLSINCTVLRSENGASGRYWITLAKQQIWEVRLVPGGSEVPVAAVLQEYLSCAPHGLLTHRFAGDVAGLVDILRAGDRRVGKRRLLELQQSSMSEGALKIIERRLGTEKS